MGTFPDNYSRQRQNLHHRRRWNRPRLCTAPEQHGERGQWQVLHRIRHRFDRTSIAADFQRSPGGQQRVRVVELAGQRECARHLPESDFHGHVPSRSIRSATLVRQSEAVPVWRRYHEPGRTRALLGGLHQIDPAERKRLCVRIERCRHRFYFRQCGQFLDQQGYDQASRFDWRLLRQQSAGRLRRLRQT